MASGASILSKVSQGCEGVARVAKGEMTLGSIENCNLRGGQE